MTDSDIDVPQSDRYLFGERISKTGYGEVWIALDRLLNQQVAIKRIDPWFSSNPGALETLRTEVIAGRTVGSAHVMKIFDLVKIDRYDCLVMEYLEGCTLRELLDNEKPTPDIARQLARHLCIGLSAIHTCGFAHRDLRPENIMVDDAGKAVIIDLGFAGAIKTDHAPRLPFHAPELVPSFIASDIYALGALFALIGGSENFEAPCPWAPWMDSIVRKCRRSQPGERYSSVQEVLEAIDCVDRESAPPERTLPRWLRNSTGICAVAALAAATVSAVRPTQPPAAGDWSVRYLVMPGSDNLRSEMLADLVSVFLEAQHLPVTHLSHWIDLKKEPRASAFRGPVVTVKSTAAQSSSAVELTVAMSGRSTQRTELLQADSLLPFHLLSRVAARFGLPNPNSRYDFIPDGYDLRDIESRWKMPSSGMVAPVSSDLCGLGNSIPVLFIQASPNLQQLPKDRMVSAFKCATRAADQVVSAVGSLTSQSVILRASLLRMEGRPAEAVEILRSATETLATIGPIYRALSEAALQQGFGPEAIALAKQAIQKDPLVAENYVTAARAEIAERHDELALGFLETALSLNNRSYDAYAVLGGLFIRIGKFQEAKVSLERAVEITSTPEIITKLGLADILCGNPQQGLLLLAGAASQKPSLQSLATLGAAFRWVGNAPDSRKALEKALQFGSENSTNGIELGKLAMIHAQLGNFATADRMIQTAAKFISSTETDFLYASMVVDAFADRRAACVGKFKMLRERRFLVSLALRDPQIRKVLGDEVR